MKPQSMGTILAGLEQEGLVYRQPHPTDGRQVLFDLTEKGVEERRQRAIAKRDWLVAAAAKPQDRSDRRRPAEGSRILPVCSSDGRNSGKCRQPGRGIPPPRSSGCARQRHRRGARARRTGAYRNHPARPRRISAGTQPSVGRSYRNQADMGRFHWHRSRSVLESREHIARRVYQDARVLNLAGTRIAITGGPPPPPAA